MNFENFIKKAIDALNESKVKYVVIGGIAAIFYGRARTTMDLDVVILVKEGEIEKLANSLRKNKFEADLDEIKRSLKEKTHITIFLKNSPYRIDLKGIYTSLDQASIRRRRKIKLFGRNVWIESPEDIVIAKLVYGSQQDLEDAKAILIKQKLDLNYLFKRAKEEKVFKKLKRLMKM